MSTSTPFDEELDRRLLTFLVRAFMDPMLTKQRHVYYSTDLELKVVGGQTNRAPVCCVIA